MALIDQQKAIDKFKPWLKVKGYSEGELNMLRAVIYELENLPDAEDTERSIGKFVGYTGEPCPNCGRLRVECYERGIEICEKCNWCIQTNDYWLDGV